MVVRSLLDRIRMGFQKQAVRRRSPVRTRPGDVERLETRQLLTINFNFQYQGTITANGIGFEDPVFGSARRAALADAAQQLGASFDNNATIVMDVTSSDDPFAPYLATAGSQLVVGATTDPLGGNEVVRVKSLTGVDLNGPSSDGAMDVNWANTFDISADPNNVAAGEFDFYSTVTHELLHALGFASQINQNGSDQFGNLAGQLAKLSLYDGFLTDSVGTSVLDGNGVLSSVVWDAGSIGGTSVTGGGLFFNGPAAKAANGGLRVGLYTPQTWSDGSSVSHLDDSNAVFAGSLMLSATGPGAGARTMSAVEQGVMIDLGYIMSGSVIVTPTSGLVVTDLGGTDTFDVSLGRQPLTDVVLTIASNDLTEVTVDVASLTFTPANWNVAQPVLLTGVADGIVDNTQLTAVTIAVNDALSDDTFDPINNIVLAVQSTDNDGTIPGQPVVTGPGQFPTVPNPLFEWTPVSNGQTYSLTISNFFTGAVVQQVNGLFVPRHDFATPFVNSVYSAVVQAFNSGGVAGAPSDPFIFSIGTPAVPGPPVIVSPGQSSIITTNTPTIQWNQTPGAGEYELYFLSQGVVTREIVTGVDVGGGVLAYPVIEPLNEGFNTVWIRAFNPFGDPGAWSLARGFTVDAFTIPTVPVITSPILTSTTNAFVDFAWISANARSYELWVNELPGGASLVTRPTRVIHVTEFIPTSYTHFNPLNNGDHKVWVRAKNAAGEYSAWSAPESFTIAVPPPEISILDAIGTTEDQTPQISWRSTSGETYVPGTTFNLWVNNLTTGVNRVVLEYGHEGTSFTPAADLAQGRYRAWVQTVNAVGQKSAWSAAIEFTIDQPAPGPTSLTGPVPDTGQTSVLTDRPTFEWSAADRAARYELWVNHADSNTVRIIHERDITATSFTPAAGLPQGTYTAWIRPFNAAGEVGEWSGAHTFTLDLPHPATPLITGPALNAGLVTDATPIITWISSVTPDTAITYNLELEHIASGTTVVSETGLARNPDPDIVVQSYQIGFQLEETSYRVRVQAVNAVGEKSPWTDWSTFVVDVANATTPVPISPGGTVTNNSVTFQWQHAQGNVRYRLLVKDLLSGEETRIDVNTLTLDQNGTVAVSTHNLANGTYRYWIQAFNTQGTASGWSRSMTFTVDSLAAADLDGDDLADIAGTLLLTSLRTETTQVVVLPPTFVADDLNVPADVAADVEIVAARPLEISSDHVEDVMAQFADPANLGLVD